MKVIFDENVPVPLRNFLNEYEVTTVGEQGWAGITNGELIRRVDRKYDVMILADKNLRHQQNLQNRHIALVELPTNRWPRLQPMSSKVVAALRQATPGSYTIIEF